MLANKQTQVFALNISAPFIPQFFGVQLQQILPYCDILIGNESEAAAWASANGLPENSQPTDIAKAIAALPKANTSRPRIVVITQGAQSTILVNSDEPNSPKVFPVPAMKDEDIVDTNAAGDAFAGGFLSGFILGKPLEECVQAGHSLAQICVGQVRDPKNTHTTSITVLICNANFRLVRSINGPRSKYSSLLYRIFSRIDQTNP